MPKPVLAAFLSLESKTLSDFEKQLLEKYNPAGIALFDRNLENKNQTAELIRQIKTAMGHDDFLIASDQEGGRVNRLKKSGFADYASQNILGKINSAEITTLHAKLMARDMRSVGINFNFSPVLDLEYPQTNLVLKSRCFGDDELLAAKHGRILIDTYIKNGVCPCMKHMPGHGRAVSDPHLGLPIITSGIAELNRDFYPFQQLKHCPAGMTAHICVPEIDSTNPITFSAKGIKEIIRDRIGFRGLLISDALEMKALKGSITERAHAAWNAGCDIVCYCGGKEAENYSLCYNGKWLNDQAMENYHKIKKIVQTNKSTINLDNEQKKYYSLVNQFAEDTINYDATEVLHQMQQGER